MRNAGFILSVILIVAAAVLGYFAWFVAHNESYSSWSDARGLVVAALVTGAVGLVLLGWSAFFPSDRE
jgi:hypothetical protein